MKQFGTRVVISFLGLVLSLALLLTSYPLAASGESRELLLLSGAGLRQPVEKLVETFQRETGIKVLIEYGGSGKLLARYRATGKGDVYVPGSFFYIERLAEKDQVASSCNIVFHVPVVAVNKKRSPLVRKFSDLAKPGVRVGLGDPKAMALGRSAEEILNNSGMRDEILKNVVVRAATVKQLALYVVKGDVDAGIIARADAFQNRDKVVMHEINPKWYTPEIVAAAVLKSSTNPDAARRLAQFLCSPLGVKTFEEYGFKPVNAK
ncbi:MAG: molybdate ABC transporter substrate-binding protein [Deltaproteobacteria bacterium]